MLKKLAEGSLEVAANSKVMRILAELEKTVITFDGDFLTYICRRMAA